MEEGEIGLRGKGERWLGGEEEDEGGREEKICISKIDDTNNDIAHADWINMTEIWNVSTVQSIVVNGKYKIVYQLVKYAV